MGPGGTVPARRTARRVAVTGADGFAGRWTMLAVRARGDEAVPFTRRACGDVTDAGAVRGFIERTRPDAVIHLAAVAAPAEARRDPHLAWDVNVLGTLRLATAVMDVRPDATFVFAGSSEAYGASFNAGDAPLDEDAPFVPLTTYAATKAAADMMIGQMARDGLRSIRMRPFNHTGPGQSSMYALGSFAEQVAMIEAGLRPPVVRVGNLDAERDFLDVRDVAAAYAAAAAADDVPAGTPLNVASGTSRRLADVLGSLLAASRLDISVETDQDAVRPNDVPTVRADASAAARYLGWRPAVEFERTLTDLLDDKRRVVASKEGPMPA